MYVKNKFHHKQWLDHDTFEDGFFEPKFCEVAINKKFKILVKNI